MLSVIEQMMFVHSHLLYAMESIYHLCGTLVKNSNLNKIMRGKNQINPNCGTCYKSNLDSKNATITKDKKKKNGGKDHFRLKETKVTWEPSRP